MLMNKGIITMLWHLGPTSELLLVPRKQKKRHAYKYRTENIILNDDECRRKTKNVRCTKLQMFFFG